MESLFYYNDILLASINLDFKRALYDNINWNQKMIALTGSRGVGKTTLMLQKQKYGLPKEAQSLFISMDHPYFYNRTLYALAEEFYKTADDFFLSMKSINMHCGPVNSKLFTIPSRN